MHFAGSTARETAHSPVTMNDPIIPRKEFRVLPPASVLLVAAGIPLVLWLLYGREGADSASKVTVVMPESSSVAVTAPSPAAIVPPADSIEGSQPATAAIPPPPEIHTAKDLNVLADGPWPVAEKVRLLSAAARITHPDNMAGEAAKRLVWIVKDSDYAALMTQVIFDPQTPREALETIALNIHSRSLETVKPILERLAVSPDHPLHSEAADTLAFYRQAAAQ